MRFLKIVIGIVLFFLTFALTNKVLTTLGMLIIKKSEIDTTLEFGANMVAINTLVGFVIALLLSIKVFTMINKKKS